MEEETTSRINYAGQILVTFVLCIITTLFRIAVPIEIAERLLPADYAWIVSEIVYMGIEGILLIVLVAHLIFKNAYSELGLKGFKKAQFALVLNIIYLVITLLAGYGIAFISGTSSLMNWVYIIGHTFINFIAIAFMQELIFRGYVLNCLLKLTNNKVFISIICSSIMFTVAYVPTSLKQTNFDLLFNGNMTSIILLSCGIGLFLGLLYYATNSLWLCVIIHATYSSLGVVNDSLLQPVFYSVYIVVCLVYLIYALVTKRKQSYRQPEEEEFEEIEETEEINEIEDTMVNTLQEVEKQLSNPTESQMDEEEVKEIEETQEAPVEEIKTIDIPFQELFGNKSEVSEIMNDNEEDLNQVVITNQVDSRAPLSLNRPSSDSDDLNRTMVFNWNLADEIDEPTSSFKPYSTEAISEDVEHQEGEAKSFTPEPNYIAHLETYLGEFEGVYKQVTQTNPPIDILLFVGDKFNALATNGMRHTKMNVPDNFRGYEYAELVMFIDKSFDISDAGLVKGENAWLVSLLRDLATYPCEQNSYLGWGHIVANSEERKPYYEGSKYCGVLIYPPVAQEDLRLYCFKEKDKETYIYCAMPLYNEEVDFVIDHSGDAYFDRMNEKGITQVVTMDRTNICNN